MKQFLIAVLLLSSWQLFAQVPAARSRRPVVMPPPLAIREVSGIVKDAAGQSVIGANVVLTSKADTLRAATNADGIYIFKNVKQNVFVISVTGIGYKPYTGKFSYSDLTKKVVLDPIVLKDDAKQLSEVEINGTPSIIYKTDTVEYKASDYKVRENSTIDELLKHMEGMEVGNDGSLTHQGQSVTKARLNGKDFNGGDVAQAIQNLPADIVDRVQIIDDYGDQAGRTGIKDGDPTKVLNITTLAEKSVASLLRATAGIGEDDRYDERLSAQRINGNEQINLIGNFRNTVNGIPSVGLATVGSTPGSGAPLGVGSPGGSGGTTTIANPSFSYRDTWSKYVQINTSYRYNYSDNNTISTSSGDRRGLLRDGTAVDDFFNNSRDSRSISKSHSFSFELEYTPDSSNFLRVIPTFSYNNSNTASSAQNTVMGYQNQTTVPISNSTSTTPSYGVTALYQYIFKKNHMRNISLQVNLSRSDAQQNTYQITTITRALNDSIPVSQVNRGTISKTYSASLQYVEPFSKTSRLEFSLQSTYKGYDNTAVTDTASSTHPLVPDGEQSNVYNYSFTQTRIGVNYNLQKPKFSISLGARAIPTHLTGENISDPTLPRTDRNDLFLIPLFRFQYQWSRTEQLTVNYTGTPSEPQAAQIQPVANISNATNTIIGNPYLKPTFTHSIVTRYNYYLPNQKVNLSANVTTSYSLNQVTTDVILTKTGSVTDYVNLSGAKSVNANYSLSKQLDDRRYNLMLNGFVNYGYSLNESYGQIEHSTTWDIQERFGPRINPNSSIEVNPYASYDLQRDFTTVPNANLPVLHRTALTVEGKFYLLADRTFTIEYNLNKNFVSGLPADIAANPFVVNAYIEKEFFKRKNGQLRLTIFDLFNQNNYIIHSVGSNGSYTDTRSNLQSRYVFLSFILNLQKFSGVPTRKGRPMNRRGDGSFIVN